MGDRAQVGSAIERYLRQPATDYALLISGPWGCGKTHFWKHEVAAQIRRAKLTSLYVSLYGLERAADIDRLLLIAQFPMLKNGMFEAFAKLTKSGLDYLNVKLPFSEIKADLKDKVICFDDLERSSASAKVSDVLGYINSLVEHDRRKVLVLANEDEITDSRYSQIKEKLFRYIYKFDAKLESIPDTWLTDGEKSSTVFRFLSSRRALMVALFASSQSSNLRSLAAAIDQFKVVWSDSGGHKQDQETVWEAVLCAVFASTFELKQDAAHKKALAVMFQDSGDAWWRFAEEDEKGAGKNYLASVESRYFSRQRVDPTKFAAVFDLVAEGTLDLPKFRAQFDHAREVLEQKGTNLDEVFATRYWDLTDEQFSTVSERKLKELREGKYVRPAELVRMARLMFPLANHGLLSVSTETLEALFLEKAERLRSERTAEFSKLDNYLSSFPFADLNDPRYINVRNVLQAIDGEAEKRAREDQLTSLVKRLASDTPGVLKELIEGVQGLARFPIFAEVDPGIIFEAICQMQPVDIIATRNFIKNRYEGHGIGRLFGAERGNLGKLSQMIEGHLKGRQPKLSTHALGVLIESLNEACKHLEAEQAEEDRKKVG